MGKFPVWGAWEGEVKASGQSSIGWEAGRLSSFYLTSKEGYTRHGGQ